jgi:pimeloyl-ACP methyl ester carboxylesterase
VNVPRLVLHADQDAVVPSAAGKMLASTIPGARFVQLDSRNHLTLEHEPAWARAAEAIGSFLTAHA